MYRTRVFAALIAVAAAVVLPAQTSNRQFAYVANSGSNNISGYALDPANGALTELTGFPLTTGQGGPAALAIDQVDGFLYVANSSSLDNVVVGFRIDAQTGALTPLAGGRSGKLGTPVALAVDPEGRYLYVANQRTSSIAVFRIDHQTGALAAVPHSPFAAGSASALALDPQGRFLYAADTSAAGEISGFSINLTTGALTALPGSPYAAGEGTLRSIAVDPLDRYLYVTNDVHVYGWSINPTSGALSSISGSQSSISGGSSAVTVAPTGQSVYVAADAVSGFTINQASSCFPCTGAGSLTTYQNSPFGSGAGSIAVDYTNTFAYATSGPAYSNGYISAFRVSPYDGSLTPFAGPQAPAGPGATSLVLTRPHTTPLYNVKRLPLPPGGPYNRFTGAAINNKAAVTGQAVLYSQSEYLADSFLYDGSATSAVNTPAGKASYGLSINDSGDIAGFFNSPYSVTAQAYLYSGASSIDLDPRDGGQSIAYSLNNAAHVVGSMSTGTCVNPFSSSCALGDTHAFLYTGNGLSDLGTLGGNFSEARSINNYDQITGGSNITANGPQHLFLSSGGKLKDLGLVPGRSTEGIAINDSGEITGIDLDSKGNAHGFLYKNGSFVTVLPLFGGIGTSPTAINGAGVVVGSSTVQSGGTTHAFVYTNGTTLDLNNLVSPSSTFFVGAVAINKWGEIIANGVDGSVYAVTLK